MLFTKKFTGEELYMTSEQKKNTTSLDKLEKNLDNIELFLGSAFNNAEDPIFIKDVEFRFVIVNDACCRFFQLPRHEIIGRTLAEKFPSREMEQIFSIDRQVLKAGKGILSEETLSSIREGTKTILTKKNRFVDSKGNYFIVGVIHDITERKKLDNALIESEKNLRKPQPIASLASWELNVINNEVNWSDEQYRILALQPRDISSSNDYYLNPRMLYIKKIMLMN